MNNNVEYQKLYIEIMEIKKSHQKLIERYNGLLSTLRNTLLIDSITYKENEIFTFIQEENKIIEEIDNILLPIIKQKMM